MIHSVGVLVDEFTALSEIGNATGKTVRAHRVEALGFSEDSEYLAYLNTHSQNVSALYIRMQASGVSLEGLEDLIPQVYSVAFASRTGWGEGQAFTGAQRVSGHLIDKLKFFRTLSTTVLPTMGHDPERQSRLLSEIDSLCEFISASGIPEADANIFLGRLEATKLLLESAPADLLVVAEQLSATLGLLAMYASKIKDKAGKQAWQERMRTAAVLFGGDLLVSLSTQAITSGAATLLALTQ
ncbi:hypothetical protein [Glutamicibacter ardleyensis]|uniref:hypothetical protein n=1 Tax=Glutamicibacter ardleyensis TaxID=225894 RepID=UPI003FD3E092